MLNNSLVSIGMPVYNGYPYIIQALEGLLNQSYSNFELLISDNASTDETQDICQDYMSKDCRIKYHRHSENKGSRWNFSHVLDLASGDFFMWAAHDDQWEPTFISKLLSCLCQMPEVVIVVSYFDTHNYVTGQVKIREENRFPCLSLENSCFENMALFLEIPVPNWFYGICRTKALRQTSIVKAHRPFDWFDIFTVNGLLLVGKAHCVKEVLFHTGVTEKVRSIKAASESNPFGFKLNYHDYYLKTLNIIVYSRETLNFYQKVYLIWRLTFQVIMLTLAYESVSPKLRKIIEFVINKLDFLLRKIFLQAA